MESNRTYRDTAGREIKLPKEVYYRCLWTVRDAGRLMKLAGLLIPDTDSYLSGFPESEKPGSVHDEGDTVKSIIIPDDVARRAASEVECIGRAIAKVPEVYREGLLDNIVKKEPLPDFAHANTWKRWKLVFLYELAKEMRLI